MKRPKLKPLKSWTAIFIAKENADKYRKRGWTITDLGPYHGIWSALATKERKRK